MKIALVGYGRMGKAIAPIAAARTHQVVTIDPTVQGADFPSITGDALVGVDVAIDFSTPGSVVSNIEQGLEHGVPVVVGTTGWLDELQRLEKLCVDREGSLIYASNFSLGVNLFSRILQNAAKIMNAFDQYDVSTVEFHHNQKVDSPSGTALSLAEVLLEELDRKTEITIDPLQRAIRPEELHCASVRCGHVPGTHEVVFDSVVDTLSLKHTARSRDGFAYGSVLAAEWVVGRKGVFTVDDFLSDVITGSQGRSIR